MDVVALRKTSGTITGEVRMNGYLQDRISFLRCSGYVEQFDVQQGELTVLETVLFSARLRLSRNNPITGTEEGRRQFVDYVLQMMELSNIQSLQVGSYEEGGLSFEQRKRLAIAVELAASPSVIFLDEPTSGKYCFLCKCLHNPHYTCSHIFLSSHNHSIRIGFAWCPHHNESNEAHSGHWEDRLCYHSSAKCRCI
jgi:ABC-type molybdenum transport system ATPase subunit/photorepair protein PhrA